MKACCHKSFIEIIYCIEKEIILRFSYNTYIKILNSLCLNVLKMSKSGKKCILRIKMCKEKKLKLFFLHDVIKC